VKKAFAQARKYYRLAGLRRVAGEISDLKSIETPTTFMATITIRLPDAKHERLRRLAERNGVSLNKLVDEWASMALAQFDTETRFLLRASRGDAKRGLALLQKLDHASAMRQGRKKSEH
jgi:predicted transcriptional regulator